MGPEMVDRVVPEMLNPAQINRSGVPTENQHSI
jgi:hypothetical protein